MRIRGWSQNDLARAIGRPIAFVNQYLTGQRDNPTNKTLQRFAAAFGVPRHVLLNDGLGEVELRSEVVRGGLRDAQRRGITIHPRALRLLDTSYGPLDAEEWGRVSAMTSILVGRKRRAPQAADPKSGSQRQRGPTRRT